MLAKDSVVELACQVNGFSRLSAAWIAWMNEVESAAQPLLVLFGLWHHEQVVPSLRCPAWNDSIVNAPSSSWQALQRLSSTMGRRAVAPVAAFCTSSATTIRPPTFRAAFTGETAVANLALR